MTPSDCSAQREPWGMKVTTEVRCDPPCRLTPGHRAPHTLAVRNYGPVAYELTVHAECAKHLRYGDERIWTDTRLCTPKMRSPKDVLETPLSLPADIDPAVLSTVEEVRIRLTRRSPPGPVEQAGEMVIYLDLKR
jgi:hypothetical protein